MKNWILNSAVCILATLLISCATKPRTLTLNFKAAPVINSEVLLPVDVIVTPDPVMKDIVRIGPEDWFGHQTREALLDDELYPLAIAGGGERTKKVVLGEDISKVIIYADFEDTIEREDQQLLINCDDKKKEYDILIRQNTLEIKK